MDPLQDPRLWAHVLASLSLRLLCKIHVSGAVYKHPSVSHDPLQDPRPRIHVSIHMFLRILCKIHVSGSVYLNKSMSSDSCLSLRSPCKIHVSDLCLSIHVLASICISGPFARSMFADSCLSMPMYLRNIHVSSLCLSILSI